MRIDLGTNFLALAAYIKIYYNKEYVHRIYHINAFYPQEQQVTLINT